MDLQKKAGFREFLPEGVLHPNHGQLDDIRGGALNGGVQGDPLGGAADVKVAAFQLRNIPAAAVKGLGIANLPGVRHHPLHIGPDAVVVVQVVVDIGPGLIAEDADVLRQGEFRDPVDNAEVHGLGMAALEGRHRLRGHAEYLGRGGGVDIRAGAEGLLHGLVPGNMGKDPQLNLAVVRVHQDAAGFRHEHLPDFRPQVRADGDVLQVGLGGAQPPRGGDQVLEGGVDAAVLMDLLDEAVGVGGFELGEHPVVLNGGDDGVLVLQLFQDIGIGGIAGLGLFHRGQAQLVKEQFSQLDGRIDVEGGVGVGIDDLLRGRDALGEHLPELLQLGPVDGNAPALHAVEHRTQGQLDLVVEAFHAVILKLPAKGRVQLPEGFGAGGGIPVLHAHPKEGGGQLGHRIVRLGGV